MGFNDHIVRYSYLASKPEVGVFLQFSSQLLLFNFVFWFGISWNDFYGTGVAESTSSTIKNFKDVGVYTQFVPDGGFSNSFPFFRIDSPTLFNELNF